MSSLDEVNMSEDQYDSIFESRWHERWWIIKFYATHPGCLWRDLWWKIMPGETIKIEGPLEYEKRVLYRWCWDNVGVRYLSWDIKYEQLDEGWNFVIKFRKGKTKHLTHLMLVIR